jgi:hypothetical protein
LRVMNRAGYFGSYRLGRTESFSQLLLLPNYQGTGIVKVIEQA